MTRANTSIGLAAVWTLLTLVPLFAQAGGEGRGRASGTAGGSWGDGGITPSFSAALGYWPIPHIGVEFELAYSKNLEFTVDLCPPPLVCILGGQLPVKGRTLSLIPHLVIEARPSEKVRPYVVGGVGMAHLRQRYTLGTGARGTSVETLVVPVEFTRSRKALALSVGGGVDVRLSRRLRIGVDVRSRHLFDEDAPLERFIVPSGILSTVRVGLHTTWMF